MNFIDICQKVDVMSGIQGMIQSVQNVVGAQEVIVESVRLGFLDLQNERMTWEFMRRTAAFVTTVDKGSYTVEDVFGPSAVIDPAAPYNLFGRWQRKHPAISYRIYDPDSGKWSRLTFVDYRRFRDAFKNRTTELGQPRYITANEQDDTLEFNAIPDKMYTVEADYFVEPQVLTDNASVPILPTRFHQLLVYRGLERVANHYGNPSLYQRYAIADAKLVGDLYRDQNPNESVQIRPVA